MKQSCHMKIFLTLIILALASSSLCLMKPARADSLATTIYALPQTPSVNSTLNFPVDIKIRNIYQMTSYEIHVDWNPTLLSLTTAQIIKGPFLSNNSQFTTLFYKLGNITGGTLDCIEEQFPSSYATAVGTDTGNATLFTLNFTAVGTGQCTLHLHDAIISLKTSNLPVQTEDGQFNNQQLTIPYNGVNYNVTITSNSTAHNLNFSDTNKTFSFNVSGPAGTTGYANITIPKDMLSVDPAQPPYVWEVILDGVPQLTTSFSVTTNATHTFIYFTYTHSDHSIAVIGNKVGPEIGLNLYVLILMFAAIAMLPLLFKRRRQQAARQTT